MREIVYRAKQFDTGEWIYGYLVQQKNNLGGIHTCIFQNFVEENRWEMKRVDSNTVCQYTGLHDKNNKRIFEGDIVNCSEKRGNWFSYCKVLWNDKKARFDISRMDSKDAYCSYPLCVDDFVNDMYINGEDHEILGNIFDNPELLNYT